MQTQDVEIWCVGWIADGTADVRPRDKDFVLNKSGSGVRENQFQTGSVFYSLPLSR